MCNEEKNDSGKYTYFLQSVSSRDGFPNSSTIVKGIIPPTCTKDHALLIGPKNQRVIILNGHDPNRAADVARR